MMMKTSEEWTKINNFCGDNSLYSAEEEGNLIEEMLEQIEAQATGSKFGNERSNSDGAYRIQYPLYFS